MLIHDCLDIIKYPTDTRPCNIIAAAAATELHWLGLIRIIQFVKYIEQKLVWKIQFYQGVMARLSGWNIFIIGANPQKASLVICYMPSWPPYITLLHFVNILSSF